MSDLSSPSRQHPNRRHYRRRNLQLKVAFALSALFAVPVPAVAQTEEVRTRSPVTVAQTSPTSVCATQLDSEISRIVNRPEFARSRWGILVQTLAPLPSNRRTLYARDSQKYFTPASNTKLLTTAAALRQFGTRYRIRTSLFGSGELPNLAVLRIVGRGDPSFDTARLDALVKQLQQKGVRQITQLIADDNYFRGSIVPPNWEWEDVQAGYGAAVNSLILNENAIGLSLVPQAVGQPLRVVWDDPSEASRWRVDNQSRTIAAGEEFVEVGREFTAPVVRVRGELLAGAAPEPVAISVPDPTSEFLRKFRDRLNSAGITVARVAIATTPRPATEVELAFVESPSLAELVTETNQQSNNLYAEALLRTLGTAQNSTADSTESGLRQLKATLTAIGVPSNSYVIVDGSGLSRLNLISPEALVQALQGMAQSPEASAYRASLPVAGVSGTLQNRFRNTPAQTLLVAKTGTLTGAVALSGYLSPPNHPPIAFSILANNTDQSTNRLRQAVDEVAVVLARLRSC